jgi:hypothetical protein
MADEYIFGPFDTDYSSYTAALNYANKYRADSSVPRFSVGDTITITKGELHPSVEQTMLDDLAARSRAKKAQEDSRKQEQTKKPTKQRKANYGRWEILNNWVDFGQHYFSTAAGRVWLAIFRMADGNTNVLEFSVRTLANKAGVTNKATQKAVAAFVEAGVLVCIFRSKKKGVPSKYRLADATNELTKRPAKPR